MNKLLIIGIILLLTGIGADFFMEATGFGFLIGAVLGAGVSLILIGAVKQFE